MRAAVKITPEEPESIDSTDWHMVNWQGLFPRVVVMVTLISV